MKESFEVVSGDFEGNFYTHQRSILTTADWNSGLNDHEIHLYRGELKNISKESVYEPEKFRNRESILLHNITNVQFHLPPNSVDSNSNRIFNFDQLLLRDAVVKESWELNGKTYGIISGKLLGRVKEEISGKDPFKPIPFSVPPVPPMPPIGPIDRIKSGCLGNIWRLLLGLLLLLLMLWLLKGCLNDNKSNQNCCIERDSLSEKLSKANTENNSLLQKVILLQDSLLKCKDENTKFREIEERRRKRGGKIGALTFTLIWDTQDDLDLMVTDPSGERINFKKPRGSNGGILDVDANRCLFGLNCKLVDDPVENIFWLNEPPVGIYEIEVQFYNYENQRSTLSEVPFYLEVLENGESKSFEGVVSKETKSVKFIYEHLVN